jgi:hypothetical protein
MREMGVRGLLIYCADYRCSHSTAISGDRWPDDVRLSDIEPQFTCQACGQRGADVRPHFGWEEETRRAPTTAGKNPGGCGGIWRRRQFDEPIPLPRGPAQLVTLEDAGNYITKLPKAEHGGAPRSGSIL